MAPEHLSTLFDKNFTHGKKNGTGLGLAYCQSVIKAHGGKISVSSKLGRGTEFIVTIPK